MEFDGFGCVGRPLRQWLSKCAPHGAFFVSAHQFTHYHFSIRSAKLTALGPSLFACTWSLAGVSPSKSSAIELHPQLAQMVPPEDLYWGCHRKTYPLIFGITGLGCVRRWPISAPASQLIVSVMAYGFQGQDQSSPTELI